MKSIREESTNETQPISWIQIGVAWKVAADAVLSKIQHEGSAKVGIQFGDSVMKSTTTICQNVLHPTNIYDYGGICSREPDEGHRHPR